MLADVAALIGIAALPLLKFAAVTSGLSVLSGGDHTWINLPMKAASRAAILQGAVPLWNKALSCGTPHLAQAEAGVFYAGNVLCYLPIDLLRAYGWTMLGHLVLLGWASYALLRVYGCRPHVAGVLSGLLTVSPYVLYNMPTSNVFQTFWFIPVLLLCVEWARRGAGLTAGAVGGLLLGQQLMLGRPTVVLYTWIAIAIVAGTHVLVAESRGIVFSRSVRFFAVSGFIGLLCGAVQLLPTLEFIPLSSRGSGLPEDFTTAGSWLGFGRLYAMFLFPAFPFDPGEYTGYHASNPYVGIVPLALMLWGLRLLRGDRRRALPVLAGIAASLLLAMGPALPGLRLLWTVPPLSMLRYPGRALPLFLCLACLLAAMSWEDLLRRARRPRRPYWVALLILVGLGFASYGFRVGQIRSPGLAPWHVVLQLLPIAIVVSWPHARRSVRWWNAAIVCACAIQAAPLVGWYGSFAMPRGEFRDSFSALEAVARDPSGQRRTIISGMTAFGSSASNPPALGNGGILAGTDVVNEFNQFTWGPWRRFERRVLHPRVQGVQPMPPGRAASDLIGLRWLYVPASWPIRSREWEVVAATGRGEQRMQLWRRRTDAPVGSVVYEVVRAESIDPEKLALVAQDGTFDFGRQVLLEDATSPALRDGERGATHAVEEQNVGPNAFRFAVRGPRDGYFVLRDHDAPGWRARVDGEAVPHYRANAFFKAVYLPAGEHTIEFRYRPASFRVGASLSLAGGVLGLLLLAGCLWRRRRVGRLC